MKKVFSYITIFVLLLAIFSPFVVYGQTTTPPIDPRTNAVLTAIPGGQLAKDLVKSNYISFLWDNILTQIIEPFAYFILQIMSLLLWASGYLLDKVLEITVTTFSDNINKIEGIKTVWVVVRDLMNIGFIFLLIFEGMKKILGLGGDAKKLVIGIIFTSLLLNFSLLITKVIIDASNIVTIGFYNSIVSGSNKNLTTTIDGNVNGSGLQLSQNKDGLSSVFMNTINVTSIFKKDSIDQASQGLPDKGRTSRIILLLFGSLIFLTVSIAFIAVSAMFLVRYITLIVLMVLSPVAFMGYAFPSIQSSQKDWWTTLKGQCLFGPIYMFMTWMTLVLAAGIIPQANDPSGWAGLVNGKGANIVLVINLAVVLGLVIMSIKKAKEFAVMGSSMLGTATNWLTAAAGGVLMGGVAGGVLRNTVGRAGSAISESEWLKDKASKGGVGGAASKLALKAGVKTASSSFDIRATETSKNVLKQMGGIDLGKVDPKKTSYRAILDNKKTEEEKFAKMLKPTDVKADAAKAQAKVILESDTFAEEEKNEKNKYLGSEEYKNSDIYKKAVKAEKEKSEIERRQSKLEEEKNKIDEDKKRLFESKRATTDPLIKAEIQKEIDTKNSLVAQKESALSELKTIIEEKDKIISQKQSHEKTWLSDKKKELIAQQGGQEEKKTRDGKNILQQAVLSYGEKRIESYADTFQKQNGVVRWTNNLGKLLSIPLNQSWEMNSKADNDEIARKIKGIYKKKGSKEKAIEEAMKAIKESDEKDESVDEKPKDEGEKKEDKKDDTIKTT